MPGTTIDELLMRQASHLGTSEWVLIDQAMIDAFAEATGDNQFIHVDPDMARLTPFGGTIAHGFLLLSLMPQLIEKSDVPRVEGIRMGINYGGDKVRFLAPVRSGSRVRGQFDQIELIEKRPGQYQQSIRFTLEVEGGEKPAMIAEWITQFFV